MKILLLTDRLDAGGAETHIAELARGLRRLGLEVECLSSGGRIADQLESEGFRQHRVKAFSRNPCRLLSLRRHLKKLIRLRGYDVLHAHARLPALLLRGLKKSGCVRIVTVHAQFSVNPILSRLCYWGDGTVAVSEDLRRYVCDRYGIPGERVWVIGNGIDCDRFSPCEEQRASREIRILFASRLDRDCSLGAKLLCRIAPVLCRSYPQLQIGIAGGGEQLSEIQTLADGVNAALSRSCVRVYGQVNDMTSLLQAHDIFVGVSRAAMEAAACGCATVLCGDEGYLGILNESNFMEASLSNFCCRGASSANAGRLEGDLRRLLENEPLRRRFAAEAMEGIRSAYTTEKMCKELLSLYHRLHHPPYCHKLLVSGYFGCGNVGDDAILLGFLDGMHTVAPEIQIQALTKAPDRSARRFGIRCISRKNPVAIRKALREADTFVCGGGSLLQNVTSRRSLHYYLSLLRMAKRANCKVILYAAGIGPICGRSAEKKLIRTLNACDYISVRDPDSMRYLTERGTERSLLHEGADPALLLPLPPIARTASLLHEIGISSAKRRLCIVLRDTPKASAHLWRSVVIASRILCRRKNLQPIFLSFCKEDSLAVEAVCMAFDTPMLHVRSVADLAALLRDSHGVLSMRLHPLVLSAVSATPAIGLSIDPRDRKMTSFARLSGQELLPYSRPSIAELVALGESVFALPSPQKANLTLQASAEMRKKAWKDLANIVEMIYNKENGSEKLDPSGLSPSH